MELLKYFLLVFIIAKERTDAAARVTTTPGPIATKCNGNWCPQPTVAPCTGFGCPPTTPAPVVLKAVATITLSQVGLHGSLTFTQSPPSPVQITGVLSGLAPNKRHGLIIHEHGDVTEGCASSGGHFNPLNLTHGGPTDKFRHVGDLGNILGDGGGRGAVSIVDPLVSLVGDSSVVGRMVVVHGGEDDYRGGSLGPVLGCGVIGWANRY